MQACAAHWWANLGLLNNQLPAGGCFNITWSLAVQAQFYALLPIALVLLKPRTPGFRCLPVFAIRVTAHSHICSALHVQSSLASSSGASLQ